MLNAINLRDPSFYLEFLCAILTVFTEIVDRVFFVMLESLKYFFLRVLP